MNVTYTTNTIVLTLTKSDALDLFSFLLEIRMLLRSFNTNPSPADEFLHAIIYDLQQTLREIEDK